MKFYKKYKDIYFLVCILTNINNYRLNITLQQQQQTTSNGGNSSGYSSGCSDRSSPGPIVFHFEAVAPVSPPLIINPSYENSSSVMEPKIFLPSNFGCIGENFQTATYEKFFNNNNSKSVKQKNTEHFLWQNSAALYFSHQQQLQQNSMFFEA